MSKSVESRCGVGIESHMPKLHDDDNNSPSGEGNKHKEIVGIDGSLMSCGVEIKQSLTESSSAPYYSRFHELIDEMENHESSSLHISDPLRFFMERYPPPERDEGSKKETEASSFPQAWSMIDFPNFKANLDEAEKKYPKRSALGLVRLIDSFGSAFSGVSFTWEDISKDPLSSTLDLSNCPGYDKLVDWIVNHGPTLSLLRDFTVWAFGHSLDSLFHYRWKKGGYSPPTNRHLSDVSIFAALALVLRSHPIIIPMKIRALDEINLWYQKKGAVTCPISVWMVHQISFGDLHAAFYSWVRFLLPQLQLVPPHSSESILQLVEKIFEKPEAQTQLVESPTYWSNIPLLPPNFFDILLRVTFSATEEEDTTTRLLKIYTTSLKKVALACALLHEQLPRDMFTLSLRLAGEGGNPVLAKEAIEIAIWCMKQNVGCWDDFSCLCSKEENLEASVVALLKTLTENESLHLTLLLPSKKALIPVFIRPIFTFSLTLAGEGNPNPILAKEAAKISIWCLTQHVHCWSHLRDLYKMNVEASVALLKALVDEWPALSLKLPPSSGKHFIQQIFTVCLGLLAEEENHVLAKEATDIAIWSLTQNVDCWTVWKNLFCSKENQKASVVLLKTLVEKWQSQGSYSQSLQLSSLKLIIREMVTISLNTARRGISILDTTGVPGNPVLLGQASVVAIWSLTEILDCCRSNRWDDLYMMILEDSCTLLNNLVNKCEDLSLGGVPEREALMKQVFQQIFTFSFRLVGRAKGAIAISIWSLTKNFDCCKDWDNLYEEDIKASVALLKKLVREWNDHSLKLSSSPSDALTLALTIKSFRLKNQKATAEGGGANGYLFKDADKFCNVISGRLSRGSCSLKWAFISYVVLVASLVPFYLTVFGLYK